MGLDVINDYYDVNLKYARLAEAGIPKFKIEYGVSVTSEKNANYRFVQMALEDQEAIDQLFVKEQFDVVCNLAAQPGVRYSLENPRAYVTSNIVGFVNLLEGCRHHKVPHFVYASSSSVYGLNENIPFSTADNVDHPVSLYAASKKSNELMAHTYSHLFDLPTTGLRFFTVYGPWGRPDMAYFLFANAIENGKPIKVFNNGDMMRDFTYVDDIVEGIVRVLDHPPSGDPHWDGKAPNPASSPAPYKVYNIGNQQPVQLMEFIEAIEETLGQKAVKEMLPMQPGDVKMTYADVSELVKDFGYKPTTTVREGIGKFVAWYKEFYKGIKA